MHLSNNAAFSHKIAETHIHVSAQCQLCTTYSMLLYMTELFEPLFTVYTVILLPSFWACQCCQLVSIGMIASQSSLYAGMPSRPPKMLCVCVCVLIRVRSIHGSCQRIYDCIRYLLRHQHSSYLTRCAQLRIKSGYCCCSDMWSACWSHSLLRWLTLPGLLQHSCLLFCGDYSLIQCWIVCSVPDDCLVSVLQCQAGAIYQCHQAAHMPVQ
jgi:hypothetical protein